VTAVASTRAIRDPLGSIWILPALVLAFASVCADMVAMLGRDPIGIWTLLPAGPVHGHWLGVEVSSFALFMTAVALIRRKPLGFVLAMIAMIAAVVVHGVFLHHPVAASVAAALAIVLFTTRDRYGVASDAHGARIAVILAALAGIVVLGAWILDIRTGVHGSAPMRAVAEWLDLGTATMPGSTLLAWALVGAHLAIIGAILLTLTPAADQPSTSDVERSKRALARYGRGALLPYLVEPPCRPFALPDGRAALAYASAGRTAVAVGDPAGEPDAVRASFDAWADRAVARDWIPVVYQASEPFASELERTGWHGIRVGSEAFVDPGTFDLATSRLANVRHTVTRSRRGGLEVAVTSVGTLGLPAGIDPGSLGTLDRAWRRRHGPALGFTVGRFDPDGLDDAVVAVGHVAGVPVSFVVLRPTGVDGGWMLDLMRRGDDGPPGAVEACLVAAIDGLGRAGVRRLSLGLAPLAGLDARHGPLEERALAAVARLIRPVYDADGLAFFKSKFGADWEPRYLLVAHRWQLPAAAIGLLRLHLGGSWLAVGRSLAAGLELPRLGRGPLVAG
jgi:phosphatidylglycerol lysyltransferase